MVCERIRKTVLFVCLMAFIDLHNCRSFEVFRFKRQTTGNSPSKRFPSHRAFHQFHFQPVRIASASRQYRPSAQNKLPLTINPERKQVSVKQPSLLSTTTPARPFDFNQRDIFNANLASFSPSTRLTTSVPKLKTDDIFLNSTNFQRIRKPTAITITQRKKIHRCSTNYHSTTLNQNIPCDHFNSKTFPFRLCPCPVRQRFIQFNSSEIRNNHSKITNDDIQKKVSTFPSATNTPKINNFTTESYVIQKVTFKLTPGNINQEKFSKASENSSQKSKIFHTTNLNSSNSPSASRFTRKGNSTRLQHKNIFYHFSTSPIPYANSFQTSKRKTVTEIPTFVTSNSKRIFPLNKENERKSQRRFSTTNKPKPLRQTDLGIKFPLSTKDKTETDNKNVNIPLIELRNKNFGQSKINTKEEQENRSITCFNDCFPNSKKELINQPFLSTRQRTHSIPIKERNPLRNAHSVGNVSDNLEIIYRRHKNENLRVNTADKIRNRGNAGVSPSSDNVNIRNFEPQRGNSFRLPSHEAFHQFHYQPVRYRG